MLPHPHVDAPPPCRYAALPIIMYTWMPHPHVDLLPRPHVDMLPHTHIHMWARQLVQDLHYVIAHVNIEHCNVDRYIIYVVLICLRNVRALNSNALCSNSRHIYVNYIEVIVKNYALKLFTYTCACSHTYDISHCTYSNTRATQE